MSQRPRLSRISRASLILATIMAFSGAAHGIGAPPEPPTALEFAPLVPRAGADLSAVIISGADVDGDPVTTTCTWRVNGQPQGVGYILPHDRFTTGDVVSLEARASAPASGPAERAMLREEIGRALADLPESHRSALMLREFGDLSYAEIAETLGVTTGVVKTWIYRARRRLADLLDRDGQYVGERNHGV